MRATNLPIRDLQRYASLRELGEATSLDRRKILEDHQAVIASQIHELEKAHALLTHKISNYRKIEERLGLAGAAEPAEQMEEQPAVAVSA